MEVEVQVFRAHLVDLAAAARHLHLAQREVLARQAKDMLVVLDTTAVPRSQGEAAGVVLEPLEEMHQVQQTVALDKFHLSAARQFITLEAAGVDLKI